MVAARSIRIGVGFTPVRAQLLASASALQDNFDDNSRDPQWNVGPWFLTTNTAGTTVVSEVNSRLELTPSGNANDYSGYVSADFYDFTNGAPVFAKVTAPSAIGSRQEVYLSVGPDANNFYAALWSSNGSVLWLRKSVNGVLTDTVLSGIDAWWRLRHIGGNILLDTAPATASNPPIESDWTNRNTQAADPAIPLTTVKFGIGSGCWGAGGTTPQTVQIDGLNTATTGSGPTGTVAATESADTAAASGASTISGTIAVTEADDTASVTGSVSVTGSIASTEAGDTASATGTVSAASVTGSVAATEASDAASASGTASIAGAASATEAGDTASASGIVAAGITGSIAATEAADGVAAFGSVLASGSMSAPEAADLVSGGGQGSFNKQIYWFICTTSTYASAVPVVAGSQREFNRRTANAIAGLNSTHRQVGDMVARPVSTPVNNHLLCDGSAVSRVGFPQLFAEIGSNWGEGDGITTFNLPNMLTASLPNATTAPAQTITDTTVATTSTTITQPSGAAVTGGSSGGNTLSGGRVGRSSLA